ncbi:hypothetical protein AV656_03550 [Bhargavaea cecembensis]|uniref:DUF421 domain-containing protein n=1 Tax=Bhargavaea cecembensis TaxID=394098 RepID=A0A161RIP8_9BACL|nr:DUF421 domain-containing protein [Bhargavaea cecembensis]KZE38018.1 hypothetical protein AV656_03550 [Bhargavaea cecembensis]
MDYLLIAGKLVIGIVFLLVIVRLLGRKELAEMTPFDIVYLLIFGGILEESIYDDKVSIWMLIFALILFGLIVFAIEKIAEKSDRARVVLMGTPDYIIKDGKLNAKRMKRNMMEMEQLRIMLRQNGIFSLKEVKDLVIEPGGSVSINTYSKYKPVTAEDLNIEKPEEDPTVLLIDNGFVKEDMLELVGKSKQWLYDQLAEQGYHDAKQILYCEWSETEGFYIRTYADTTAAGGRE